MKKSILFKTGLLVILLILLGKVLAFGKDIVVSAYFGASTETDALFMALNITAVLFFAFYSTISLVFLPLYNEQKIRHGIKSTYLFSSQIINLYLLVTLVVSALVVVFAEQIVSIVDFSSDPVRRDLTIDLLRIMCFSFTFTVFIGFMTSVQLCNDHYIAPHLAPVISNFIVLIAVVLFSTQYGIYIVAIAGVIAWIIQIPFHLWVLRSNFKYKFKISFSGDGIKKMGFLFFPAFLGVFVDQLNIMVDTMLASDLTEGSISALNYASRLVSFSSGIFVLAIMSIMYPIFSKLSIANEKAKLDDAIRTSLRLLLLVLTPVTAVIFIFSNQIVSVIFERGAFDANSTSITASVFFFYGLGVVFIGFRELFNKVFYALKDTKTPLYISIVSVGLNIVFSLVLVEQMGVQGLALASSIALSCYVVIQLLVLYKRIGTEFLEGVPFFILKLFSSMILMVLLMYLYTTVVAFNHDFLLLAIGALLGVIVYVAFLFIFQIDEVLTLYTKIKRKTSSYIN